MIHDETEEIKNKINILNKTIILLYNNLKFYEFGNILFEKYKCKVENVVKYNTQIYNIL